MKIREVRGESIRGLMDNLNEVMYGVNGYKRVLWETYHASTKYNRYSVLVIKDENLYEHTKGKEVDL